MGGQKGSKKDRRDNREITDGLIAAFELAKKSQCTDCKNSLDPYRCKVYGEKPDKYVFTSYNTPCDKHESR